MLPGITGWVQLFGIVSFELSGQFNDVIEARADFFGLQMEEYGRSHRAVNGNTRAAAVATSSDTRPRRRDQHERRQVPRAALHADYVFMR